MNTPTFQFKEEDNTLGVSSIAQGIMGLQGRFKRGPICKPDILFYDWPSFLKTHGGFMEESDDPLLAYRAFENGAILRVNNLRHFEDQTDFNSLTAEKATMAVSRFLVIDRDTSTGSVFTATLNGNPISVSYGLSDTHLGYMEAIAEALSIEFVSQASVFQVPTGQYWGIVITPKSGVVLNLVSPSFSGSTNGPNVAATAELVVPADPTPQMMYYVVNQTTGQYISEYEAQPGDTNTLVAAGLVANQEDLGYTLTNTGATLTLEAPEELGASVNTHQVALLGNYQGVPEERATVLFRIANSGTLGEVIEIETDSTVIATVTVQAGLNTSMNIAASINSGGSGYICQFVSNNQFRIIGPPGSGDSINGNGVDFNTTGSFEVFDPATTFQGGVTEIASETVEVTETLEDGVFGGTGNPSLTSSTKVGIVNNAGIILFELLPKNEGADYNNLWVEILTPSNNTPGYFNMRISHLLEPSIPAEVYPNLLIPNYAQAGTYSYLSNVTSYSNWVVPEYKDLQGLGSGIPTPLVMSVGYTGGDNGDTVEEIDYIGSETGETGLHAFTPYSDMMIFACGQIQSFGVHVPASEYATSKKQMVYAGHIDSDLTFTQAITAMVTSGIDTDWAMFYTGSIRIKHPATGQIKVINEIGDLLGLYATSHIQFGENYAVYNETRGLLTNTLGAYKNYGGPGNYEKLNALANNRINAVVTENGKTMLWGNTTAKIGSSVLQFINIRMLGLKIKKDLSPIMREYLGEPNDIPTWMIIYLRVKPYLDGWLTKRAFYSYSWLGDQFASNLDTLSINQKADVQLGKYKAKIKCSPIPGMNEFELTLSYDFNTGDTEIS